MKWWLKKSVGQFSDELFLITLARVGLTGAWAQRPLQNAQFCSRSRKTKILTRGIHLVFWGLKFESDADIGQKGVFCKGLSQVSLGRKEIYAVVERYFSIGIQMSLLCFTNSPVLTDRLCLYKLIYLKTFNKKGILIIKLLDVQITKRDLWKTFNFVQVQGRQ